jgi:hypothetical protein
MTELEQLRLENQELKRRLTDLERELLFLKTHPTLSQGLKGETLVAQLTGGELTHYAAEHDITLGNSIRIEVKFSKLNSPSPGNATRRWNWSKPLGWKDKGKNFDFLLLVGDKDPRFPKQYLDDSPYVFFLIPKHQVQAILTRGSMGANVQLTTNLSRALSEASCAIKKHLVPATLVAPILEKHVHQTAEAEATK